MNVIRHDHITTYSDVELGVCTLGEKNERSVDLILCQEPLSCMRAEGDKIKRTCCEHASQPRWSSSEVTFHARSVTTALRAIQSKDVMPLVSFTGHRPVAKYDAIPRSIFLYFNLSSSCSHGPVGRHPKT